MRRVPALSALRVGFASVSLLAGLLAQESGRATPLRVLVLRSSGKPLAGATLSYLPAPPHGLPWLELAASPGVGSTATTDARGEAVLATTGGTGALLVEHESGLGAFVAEVGSSGLVRVDVVPCGRLLAPAGRDVGKAAELDLDLAFLAADGTRVAIGVRRGRTIVLPPGRWLHTGQVAEGLCDGVVEVGSGQQVTLAAGAREGELAVLLPAEGAWSVRLPGATRDLPRDAAGLVRVPGGSDLRRIVVRGTFEGVATRDEVWLEASAARPFRYVPTTLASTPIVVRSASGAPVADAVVLGLHRSGDRLVPRSLTRSDATGRALLLRDGRAGRTSYCVLAAGHGFVAGTALLTEKALAVTLPPEVPVTVRSVAPGGAPVGGRHLVVRDATEPWFTRRLVTGPDGTTVVRGIGSGALEFELDEPGTVRVSAVREFGSAAPGTQHDHEVVLEVAPGADVRGRLFSGEGKPLRGVAVTLRDTTGTTGVRARHTLSDAEGRFTFEGLPDHLFTLSASHESDGKTWSGEVRGVQPGADEWRLEVRSEDPVPPGRKGER